MKKKNASILCHEFHEFSRIGPSASVPFVARESLLPVQEVNW